MNTSRIFIKIFKKKTTNFHNQTLGPGIFPSLSGHHGMETPVWSSRDKMRRWIGAYPPLGATLLFRSPDTGSIFSIVFLFLSLHLKSVWGGGDPPTLIFLLYNFKKSVCCEKKMGQPPPFMSSRFAWNWGHTTMIEWCVEQYYCGSYIMMYILCILTYAYCSWLVTSSLAKGFWSAPLLTNPWLAKMDFSNNSIFFFRYRYKKPHKRTKMNETKHMKYIIESKPTISKQKLCVLIHDTCISEPTVFFGCCYVLFFGGFWGSFCIFFIIFKKEITGDLTKMTIIFFCPLGGCIYKLSNTFD